MTTSRRRLLRGVLVTGFTCLQLATSAGAAPPVPQEALRVETFLAPPFVIEQGKELTGFGIDIWKEVAARMHVDSIYELAATPNAGFEALRSKHADLAVSAVFITVERDREFDFSYPIMEAGQQVMVRESDRAATTVNPLRELLRLFSKTTGVWLGTALLLVLVPAHIVWLLERRHKEGIIPTQQYFPGIFYAAYWSASTLLTQAEQMPRQWLARVTALLWMFAGVVFVALYTAQLTATLTVQEMRGPINGPEDLPGKQVGTLAESVGVQYLRDHNAKIQEFTKVTDLYQALLDKKVDAVLLAAPALRYYEAHDGKGLVKVVGPEFDKGELAFVFPDGSPLRRRVNTVLVAIRADGTYLQFYEKWFGSDLRAVDQ